MDKRRESSRTRRIRRTKVDWFGIIMMFVLLVCSLAIFARLMATKMLTTTNLVLIMAALLVVNGLHIFVQLPLRRNKLGKLICGVLAVLLSAGMIYGTVAAGAVQSALSKISGIMVEKQVTAVIVMKEDEAADLLKEIQKQLKKRQWGEAIRLEVEEKKKRISLTMRKPKEG